MSRQRRAKTKKLRLPGQPLQRAHQHGGQREQDKIDRYARDGHQKIIPAAMAQVVGIDRHRLCPANARQKHHQRADQAEVPQGIERQPPRIARGRIAAAIGYIAVCDFMQNKRQQHSRGAIEHKAEKRKGIRAHPFQHSAASAYKKFPQHYIKAAGIWQVFVEKCAQRQSKNALSASRKMPSAPVIKHQ